MAGLLIVISGPSSGVGKDSVTREVEKRGDFVRVITFTSRDKRRGEKEGVDYHFITREEFLKKESGGFFLETNEYLGNLYGTPKGKVLKAIKSGGDALLRVDVNGAKAIKQQIPKALLIFISAPFGEMKKRLIKRAREDKVTIGKKLKFAKKEMAEKIHFDYVVMNRQGRLEKTVEMVLEIVKREKC